METRSVQTSFSLASLVTKDQSRSWLEWFRKVLLLNIVSLCTISNTFLYITTKLDRHRKFQLDKWYVITKASPPCNVCRKHNGSLFIVSFSVVKLLYRFTLLISSPNPIREVIWFLHHISFCILLITTLPVFIFAMHFLKCIRCLRICWLQMQLPPCLVA